MGYAFGELYGTEILANMKGMEDYGLQMVADFLEPFSVPLPMVKYI
jgi:hypothetical protein